LDWGYVSVDSVTIPRLHLHATLPLPAKIRQIDGLQVLRAVAVLLVAMLHTSQALSPEAPSVVPDFGSYGVDIFFVISGFIMSAITFRSDRPAGPGAAWAFLKRRLIRIFPIYWIFVILTGTRMLLSQGRFDLSYLPSVFLLPGSQFPYFKGLVSFSWTMMFEMYFYYVFAVVLLITVRRAVPLVIVLLSFAVILGSFVGIARPYFIVACNPMLLEFLFGAALALLHQHFGTRRRTGMVLLSLGVIASFVLRNSPFPWPNGLERVVTGANLMPSVLTWGVAAAMMVGGIIFWQPEFKTRLGKIAVILGNASYSTYLASGLTVEFTDRLLLKIHRRSVPLSYGMEAFYEMLIVASVFVVGWACYQFIEWPMLRSLQGKLRKAPA
jgi:exopolysaccharide production protein ExoZ